MRGLSARQLHINDSFWSPRLVVDASGSQALTAANALRISR
jgi:hypothetical protein